MRRFVWFYSGLSATLLLASLRISPLGAAVDANPTSKPVQDVGLSFTPQPWITGYYPAGNKVQSVTEIPWHKYTEINHFAAAAGVDDAGKGNGTVQLHYLTPAEIELFVSQGHQAGKLVVVTIKDNDRYRDAFGQSTAPWQITAFVHNIAQFVNTNGYDGVDLDWEDKVLVDRYVELLTRLRQALKPTQLITIAAGNWSQLEKVASRGQNQINHLNIMCYDMDNTGSYVWHNAALRQSGDPEKMTCDWRVRAFIEAGVAPAKIGIGIPFYGRRWTGATQPLQTTGTRSKGWINYRDLVADAVRWQPEHRKWDARFGADYLSIPTLNEFISYNGQESIRAICQWAETRGFGGFMSFELSNEYRAGETGDARYPLSTFLWTEAGKTTNHPTPAGGGGK
jgi:GH18 family chitinase